MKNNIENYKKKVLMKYFYFKEQVNEWTKKIRKEGYQLDRQINAIKREELKVS